MPHTRPQAAPRDPPPAAAAAPGGGVGRGGSYAPHTATRRLASPSARYTLTSIQYYHFKWLVRRTVISSRGGAKREAPLEAPLESLAAAG